MSQVEELKIRPYARLLTMLGNQLIKDEAIALIELVKNAYDADAENVIISLRNFNPDYSANKGSSIIIEDDGNGMNDSILKSAWLNPATPEKLRRKKEKNSTDKGRIIQGEKGIGRFAIFKLGKTIEIITRRQKQVEDHFIDCPEDEYEYVVKYDFSDYDADFLRKGYEESEIYLDDLLISLETKEAETINPKNKNTGGYVLIQKPYGTKIIISNLNGKWNEKKVEKVYRSIERMRPIFSSQFESDFNVMMYFNQNPYVSRDKDVTEIRQVLETKAVMIVDGRFVSDKNQIEFTIDQSGKIDQYCFHLNDSEMLGIKPLRNFFDSLRERKVECGDFNFKFYIMDFNVNVNNGDIRYYLTDEEKRSIRAHRVYLYRDGIRVMPYGDPEDDWLRLDSIRGNESASYIFANDQIVGYIAITQKDNPGLVDKTNREGLIEEGYAREDLVNICQLILRYLRAKPYERYLSEKRKQKENKESIQNKPIKIIQDARKKEIGEAFIEDFLKKYGDIKVKDIPQRQIEEKQKSIYNFVGRLEESYLKEKNVYESRIATTENLAAIGLSAETAYHDARILLSETDNQLNSIISNYKKQRDYYLERLRVISDIDPISAQISTISQLMISVQKLFPSTKNKKKEINLFQMIDTVRKLYAGSLRKAEIECEIIKEYPDVFSVECTDAVLLQVFINLFDNSVYWLKTIDSIHRKILIRLDPKRKEVVFSDNGPGINKQDEPYIFEAFYSGKGEEGKGLGLYIAKQLLARYDYTINTIEKTEGKLLDGANFLIDFKKEEDNNESN